MILCNASMSCQLTTFDVARCDGGFQTLRVKRQQFRLSAVFVDARYMKDGGSRAWHYDGSDFVVTLMLQPSLAGGEFEWAPFIRGKNGEENYDQVREMFQEYNTMILCVCSAKSTFADARTDGAQVKRLFHGEYPAAKTSRAGAGTRFLTTFSALPLDSRLKNACDTDFS